MADAGKEKKPREKTLGKEEQSQRDRKSWPHKQDRKYKIESKNYFHRKII